MLFEITLEKSLCFTEFLSLEIEEAAVKKHVYERVYYCRSAKIQVFK